MENRKIDELVAAYQRTRDESIFEEIYDVLRSKIPKLVRMFASKYWLDEMEVESLINLKIFEITMTHDQTKGTFENMLHQAIRCGCIDMVRKRKRIKDNEFLYDDIKDIESQAEIIDGEIEMIETIQKKVDQPALVAKIMKSVDDKTRQSLAVFMSENFSYSDAAKRLNTTRKTIKRRITNAANYLNDIEDIHDYFTVLTESLSA